MLLFKRELRHIQKTFYAMLINAYITGESGLVYNPAEHETYLREYFETLEARKALIHMRKDCKNLAKNTDPEDSIIDFEESSIEYELIPIYPVERSTPAIEVLRKEYGAITPFILSIKMYDRAPISITNKDLDVKMYEIYQTLLKGGFFDRLLFLMKHIEITWEVGY